MAKTHPVLKQHGFTVKTPPLREFVLTFSQLLRNGETSLVSYARPRFGKSCARRYLVSSIDAKQEMVVVWGEVQRDVKQRLPRDRLWRELIRSKDQEANLHSSNPYDTLIKRLQVEADARDTDKVIICLDEGQNLTLEGLGDLKKLVDDLTDLGLSPFVVISAQPEILLRPERLKRFHKEDLVDRFFTHAERFRGLLPSEFEEVLAHYDTATWEGVTYTRHFLPRLSAEGWTLAAQAGVFQDAFSDLNAKLGTGTNEIGMKYLVAAVRRLLTTVGDTKPTLREQADVIKACVANCGLTEAWKVVGDSERHAQLLSRDEKKTRLKESDA